MIVGAGGFGREVFHWCQAAFECRVKGFVDAEPVDLSSLGDGLRVIGNERDCRVDGEDRFVLAIGRMDVRRRVARALTERGARFTQLIHPTAVVAPTAQLGEGVVVCPFALVSDNVRLGDFSMLNFYASCGHDAVVGRYSVLSPYATLNGEAVLEDEVFLGTHATVVAGRRIGARSKISANSVAMRDVPAGALVLGVPGRSQLIFPPEGAEGSGEGPVGQS